MYSLETIRNQEWIKQNLRKAVLKIFTYSIIDYNVSDQISKTKN